MSVTHAPGPPTRISLFRRVAWQKRLYRCPARRSAFLLVRVGGLFASAIQPRTRHRFLKRLTT